MAMITQDAPKPRYITRHVTYRLPVLGRMAKEVVEGDDDNIWYAIAGGVSLWAILFLTFGYAGLIIPALALVGAMFITLIRITLG